MAQYFLVVLVAATVLTIQGVDAAPPASADMCIFAEYNSTAATLEVVSAATRLYKGKHYPVTEWNVRPMLVVPGSGTRGIVRAFLNNGSGCDFVTFAVTSNTNVALSPLVSESVAWISPSAVSTELSNKVQHPSYNRVVPTASVGSVGDAMLVDHFGWTLANVLCVDDAYGRSLTEGFVRQMNAQGGRVEASRCVADATDKDALAAALAFLRGRESRVLFIGGTIASATLVKLGVMNDFIPILPPSLCAKGTSFTGALCVAYTVDSDPNTEFEAAFYSRNRTLDAELFPDLQPSDYVLNISTLAAFLTDAVRLGMDSIYNYPDADHALYPTLATFVRSRSFEGSTGLVQLDSNGDRTSTNMGVFNMQPTEDGEDIKIVQIGTIRNGRVDTSGRGALYWQAGSGFAPGLSTEVPSDVRDQSTTTEPFPLWVIPIIAVCVLLVGFLVFRHVRRRMALARCPLDDTAAFTTMFVAVRNHAVVRDTHGEEQSGKAFRRLAAKVEDLAQGHGCHVARRVDDVTTMVVSKRPEQCVGMATELASWATASKWSELTPVATAEAMSMSRANISVTSTNITRKSVLSAGEVSDNGTSRAVRVSPPKLVVGVHTGYGSIDHNEGLGSLSYRGAVVDEAAAVTDAAVVEQVVLSAAAAEATVNEEGVCAVGGLTATASAYKEVTVPSGSRGRRPTAMQLLTLVPDGYPAERRLRSRLDRWAASGSGRVTDGDEDAASGGILDAMAQADSGFSRRRVGIVTVMIPGLTLAEGETAYTEHTQRVGQTLAAIAEASGRHRGRVVSVVGGRVIVAVNASGTAVPQPEIRAGLVALEIQQLVEHGPGHGVDLDDISIGVASGRSPEGSSSGGIAASCGLVWTWSRMAQQAAAQLQQGILATDHNLEDLASRFFFGTVDLAALPVTARRAGTTRPTRLLRLDGVREQTADGEWLYNVAADGQTVGPALTEEQRWEQVMETKAAVAASNPPSSPLAAGGGGGGGNNESRLQKAERMGGEAYATMRQAELQLIL